MAGKQVSGAGLPESIAGMSKNQLYDIMSQMKVLPFFFSLSDSMLVRFLNSVFVSEQCLDTGGMISVVFVIMQTLIEQNQQQAKQILIQNPLLTKALFQVSIFRFFVS